MFQFCWFLHHLQVHTIYFIKDIFDKSRFNFTLTLSFEASKNQQSNVLSSNDWWLWLAETLWNFFVLNLFFSVAQCSFMKRIQYVSITSLSSLHWHHIIKYLFYLKSSGTIVKILPKADFHSSSCEDCSCSPDRRRQSASDTSLHPHLHLHKYFIYIFSGNSANPSGLALVRSLKHHQHLHLHLTPEHH